MQILKNLHLAVYPPDARVHISMPDYLTDDDARNFVLQKLEWIRTQIEEDSRPASTNETTIRIGRESLFIWSTVSTYCRRATSLFK